jgi:hypothetical protein
LELKVDNEFCRDQCWFRIENSGPLGERWKIYCVVEVENDWSTIHNELNQLFHLRAPFRIGVFYPPRNVTIDEAVGKIEGQISYGLAQDSDQFLLILIPELNPIPHYYSMSVAKGTATFVKYEKS